MAGLIILVTENRNHTMNQETTSLLGLDPEKLTDHVSYPRVDFLILDHGTTTWHQLSAKGLNNSRISGIMTLNSEIQLTNMEWVRNTFGTEVYPLQRPSQAMFTPTLTGIGWMRNMLWNLGARSISRLLRTVRLLRTWLSPCNSENIPCSFLIRLIFSAYKQSKAILCTKC